MGPPVARRRSSAPALPRPVAHDHAGPRRRLSWPDPPLASNFRALRTEVHHLPARHSSGTGSTSAVCRRADRADKFPGWCRFRDGWRRNRPASPTTRAPRLNWLRRTRQTPRHNTARFIATARRCQDRLHGWRKFPPVGHSTPTETVVRFVDISYRFRRLLHIQVYLRPWATRHPRYAGVLADTLTRSTSAALRDQFFQRLTRADLPRRTPRWRCRRFLDVRLYSYGFCGVVSTLHPTWLGRWPEPGPETSPAWNFVRPRCPRTTSSAPSDPTWWHDMAHSVPRFPAEVTLGVFRKPHRPWGRKFGGGRQDGALARRRRHEHPSGRHQH